MIVEEPKKESDVPTKCRIAGWNLPNDFPSKVILTGKRKVENYQIALEDVRTYESIIKHIKTNATNHRNSVNTKLNPPPKYITIK